MPQTEAPDKITGNKEKHRNQGTETIEQAVAAPKEGQKGIVEEERQWDNIGQEFQYSITINREGITPELAAAIGENVHHLQPIKREEADRGVNQEKPGKYQRAGDNHSGQRGDIGGAPIDTATGNRPGKDGDSRNRRPRRENSIFAPST